MAKLADLVEQNIDDFAALEALNAGMPCTQCVAVNALTVFAGRNFLHAKGHDILDVKIGRAHV